MKIISFIKDGHQMLPIEVELSLSPGLPKVQFTGMADPAIKESVTRIKTAFRHQKFNWPKRKQITINLRPAYIKKTAKDWTWLLPALFSGRQISFNRLNP